MAPGGTRWDIIAVSDAPTRPRAQPRPAGPAPARARRRAWLLFLFAFLVYNANLRLISARDCVPARLLPWSLLGEGDLDLDEFGWSVDELPYFLLAVDGHVRSLYPVLIPILVTPLYLPVATRFEGGDDPSRAPLAQRMEKLSASLIGSASVALVYLALLEVAAPRAALGLALLHAFGTNAWTIGSQALWQHGFGALCVALLALGLLRAEHDPRWLLAAGLGAGLAAANRPPDAIFSALALLYVVWRHRGAWLRFVAPAAAVGLLCLAYNLGVYRHPLGGYGLSLATHHFRPRLEGLLGLLVSPSRGLFVYTPVALFSVLGALRLWRSGELPVLRWLGLGVALQVLFFGSFAMWWGGHCFGPRFLTDATPILILLLVPLLPGLARPRVAAAFAVAAALSIAVQAVGAFFYPAGLWDERPVKVDLRPERVWEWRDSQLVRSLRYGPAPLSWSLLPQEIAGGEAGGSTSRDRPAAARGRWIR